MFDIILGVVILYFATGFVIFLWQTFTEGELFLDVTYMFPDLGRDIVAIIMFFLFVGAWPVVILYEMLRKKK